MINFCDFRQNGRAWKHLLLGLTMAVCLPVSAQRHEPFAGQSRSDAANPGVPSLALTRLSRGTVVIPDSVMAQRHVSMADLLQGQVAGVQAYASEGAPGSALEILIRGRGSIRGDLQPLFILDGAQLNSSMFDAPNPWSSFDKTDYLSVQDALAALHPNDILSLEILKNTSVTAIYGDRGANGVVIIRTKNGSARRGKFDLKIAANAGVRFLADKVDMLSGEQYARYMELRGTNAGEIKGIDWQDRLFSPALDQNYHVSLSGTIRNTDYRMSGYLSMTDGIADRTDASHAGFRVNLDQRINKKLRVGTRVLLDWSDLNATSTAAYLGASSVMTSTMNAPYYTGAGENTMGLSADYDDQSTGWRLVPVVYLQYDFLPFMSLKVNGGVDYMNKNRLRWMGTAFEKGAFENARAGRSDLVGLNYNADAAIEFHHTFAEKHEVKGMVFGALNGHNRRSILSAYSDFFNKTLRAKGMSLGADTRLLSFEKTKYTSLAAGAQAAYVFDGRYTVSGGFRGDHTVDMESGMEYYPFVNASWNIMNEPFLRSNPGPLSSLEIYGGWGISGRSNVEPYSSLDDYTLGDATLWVPYETRLYYRGLWRSTVDEYNIGLRMGLFANRVRFSFEYYDGRTEDRLSVRDSSPQREHATYWQDMIRMKRHGFEFTADVTAIQKKDLRLNISFNAAIARNKVTDCGRSSRLGATGRNGFRGRNVGNLAGNDAYVSAVIDGEAPGAFYGYLTQGVLQEEHVLQTPPFKGQKLQAGDVKFIDVNRDGQVDELDKVVIGNPNPKATFGLNLHLDYKNFYAGMRFDAAYGNDVLNLNRLTLWNVSGTSNISPDALAAAQNGSGPRFGAVGLDQISDRLVEDGSYLRMSSLTLGYRIPLSRRVKWIRSLEVNLLVSNLFTITGYSGYNPLVSSFAGDWTLQGVDQGSYPGSRFVSLGISAKF